MSDVYIHPTSIVDAGAQVGKGTKIWHFCHISSGARLGQNCSLGQNVFVADQVEIGNNVKIQNNVSLYQGVQLADDVFCGPSMVFTNVNNPRSHVSRRNEYLKTRVGRGATFGANCTVVCGHDIGDFAFIGAGAVVTNHVAPYSLMLGVPARRAGWMCQCGERLPSNGNSQVQCSRCQSTYRISSEKCEPIK